MLHVRRGEDTAFMIGIPRPDILNPTSTRNSNPGFKVSGLRFRFQDLGSRV